ncbi:MAG: branched-chain amino acid aminotransferase [Bacteroidales bacterium]|nr:branched-chain amino acid aminotransferase [Bacteroidales bacterium]MBR1927523.1 branched-chain amino acid aminotransferase [Bacteroidales bacterium]
MLNIDWTKLSFSYTKTRTLVYSRCVDGQWETPVVTEDFNIVLSPFAGVFHYAPSCFEGLKAFRGVDGKIRLFRPDMNAKRLRDSAIYLDMPYPSEELFLDMCIRCVQGNLEYLPPYEVQSASLYLRPVLFGMNPQLGIHSARDVMFVVMCSPVGTYSGDKSLAPANAVISRNYDRSATHGSGCHKLGANYAQSLHAYNIAHGSGYRELLFLDSATKTTIEEFGSSNFFAIKGNTYVTPLSQSVLPSITNDSLRTVAADMGMDVEMRPIKVEELAEFDEAGSCGTAVVITPICEIDDKPVLEGAGITRRFDIGSKERCGEKSEKLYHEIIGIQRGLRPDPRGWCVFIGE